MLDRIEARNTEHLLAKITKDQSINSDNMGSITVIMCLHHLITIQTLSLSFIFINENKFLSSQSPGRYCFNYG